ncbi:hypothetical protein [Desulfonatronum parangueonense]
MQDKIEYRGNLRNYEQLMPRRQIGVSGRHEGIEVFFEPNAFQRLFFGSIETAYSHVWINGQMNALPAAGQNPYSLQ